MAMPIIDPGRMTAPPPVHRAAPDQPVLDPPVLNPEAQI
jgi:hypothetical protein